jgi:hypothetical protein
MKRSMCGLVLFAAAAGLWSCNGDPTGDFRVGETVIADPTSVFVDQGSSKFVTVEAVDSQGNQLSGNFAAQNVGAGITVEKDTTFLQTSTGAPISTSARFVVTGVAPGATSFDVTSGSATKTIPVKVVPVSVLATFTPVAPAPEELVTITLPTNFKFGADAGVATNLGSGVVRSVSVDSTSITALIVPGSTGPLTLTGFGASFLPGVSLSLATVDTIAAAPFVGFETTGTAPLIPVPAAIGDSTLLLGGTGWSGPDITGDGGVGAQYYKFTVANAGDYHFVTDWPNDADLDPVVCFDAACAGGAFAGTGSGHPEDGTLTLAPGTYYLAVVLFAGTGPDNFTVTISQDAPVGP